MTWGLGELPPALERPAVWSLGTKVDPRCGLPVVPCATSDWGRVVRPGLTAPVVWGWTGPGQHEVADLYKGRLIADVETYVTAEGAPHWTGKNPDEFASAAYLAPRCVGITSHGYVAPALREVVKFFAKSGCVAFPMVYDTDRSTLTRAGGPGKFLRECVHSWTKAGFARVVPLLALNTDPQIVAIWLRECRELGLPFHLWSLGELKNCGILDGVSPSPSPSPPAPSPSPTPWSPSPAPTPWSPSPSTSWGPLPIILLAALGWWLWRRQAVS